MKQYPDIKPAIAVPLTTLNQDTREPIKLVSKWYHLKKDAVLHLIVVMDIVSVIVVKVALMALAVVGGLLFGILCCVFTKNMSFKRSMAFTYLSSDLITSRLSGKAGILERIYKRYLK